jgi:hypothetical protein
MQTLPYPRSNARKTLQLNYFEAKSWKAASFSALVVDTYKMATESESDKSFFFFNLAKTSR